MTVKAEWEALGAALWKVVEIASEIVAGRLARWLARWLR